MNRLENGVRDLISGYELVERLGRGGMGIVYRARQVALNRWVAVKLLHPSLCDDESTVKRFISEARTAGRLRHENIVTALDCGRVGNRFYIVMELVEGESLHRILKKKGPLPEREALGIILQIAEGLQHAWENRLLHRDIKPHNIMITPDGTAKLCDLGLSREFGEDSTLTATGFVHCTPAYASPEQARGRKDLDTRSDIYSLGATLYEALTGAPPFTGDSAGDYFIKHATEPPVPPNKRAPEVTPATNRLILHMLEKMPEHRPQTPREVVDGIRAILSTGGKIVAPLVRRRIRRRDRTKNLWPLYAGLATGALGLVALLLFRGDGESPPPEAKKAPINAPRNEPRSESPTSYEDILARARGYVREKKWDEAAREVREILKRRPGQAEALRLRAEIETGRREAEFDQTMREAQEHRKARRWSEALKAADRALALKPGDFLVLELKREILTEQRRESVRPVTEAPRGGRFGGKRTRDKFDAAMKRARAHADAKKWDLALAEVASALALRPGDASALLLRNRILAERSKARYETAMGEAKAAFKKGEWDAARRAVERALAARPGDADAEALRKKILLWEARERYRKAVVGADEHLRKGRWWEATRAAQRALEARPGDSRAQGILKRSLASPLNPMGYAQLATIREHTASVTSLRFHPKGALISGCADSIVRIWDLPKRFVTYRIRGLPNQVYCAEFSADGGTIAVGGLFNDVAWYQYGPGRPVETLKGHTDSVVALRLRPDGRTLVSASLDGTIRLWDIKRMMPVRRLSGHRNMIEAMDLSPDGRVIASGSKDRTIKLWDADRGAELRTIPAHAGYVLALAFDPTGKVLASGGQDGLVKLWEAATGKLLRTLRGHEKTVRVLAMRPDGKVLASGSFDKTVRLWDVRTGELIRTLEGHTGSVRSLAFSPDGKTLVSGSEDTTMCVWGVKTTK